MRDNRDDREAVLNGNTLSIPPKKKQENQYSHYCFTFNNFENDDKIEIEMLFKKYASKYTFEKEVGKSGTRHLQGYVNFSKRKRLTELKKIFNPMIHWEVCRNVKASIDYCQKDANNLTDISSKNIISDKQKFYSYDEFVRLIFEEEYEIFLNEVIDDECKMMGELCDNYDDLLMMTNHIKWKLDNILLQKTLNKLLHESEDENVLEKYIRCVTFYNGL